MKPRASWYRNECDFPEVQKGSRLALLATSVDVFWQKSCEPCVGEIGDIKLPIQVLKTLQNVLRNFEMPIWQFQSTSATPWGPLSKTNNTQLQKPLNDSRGCIWWMRISRKWHRYVEKNNKAEQRDARHPTLWRIRLEPSRFIDNQMTSVFTSADDSLMSCTIHSPYTILKCSRIYHSFL